ncbi:MAG: hypothetical protein BMS9Abin02_0894 [Anaerolineae bacterium]|nr:MAG: hypothetical protein BMS9Abin02_0894 [Anaerolineae bacterium]
MKEVFINQPSSKAVGFIHFSCFCGLDIYCFGNSSEGKPPLKAIEKLRALLDGQPAALFTTNDRPATDCPHCGIELELPSAEVLAGFAHRAQSIVYDQTEAN